jgi:WD40 repeat protein
MIENKLPQSTSDESAGHSDVTLKEPYVGVRPYEESEHSLFFGRDRDQQLLRNKIYSTQLTILYAPSGVGKTSLLKALVIPAIRGRGDKIAYVDQWLKGDPCVGIKTTLVEQFAAGKGDPQRLAQLSLIELVKVLQGPGHALVIILDQFEQVLIRSAMLDALGRELGELVRSNLEVHVVLSLREEFLARLHVFSKQIVTLFGSTFRLDHLAGKEACQAIEGPGAKFRMRFAYEPKLVVALLVDLKIGSSAAGAASEEVQSEGIDLPIMQIVCDCLWRDSDGTLLTLARYVVLGGRDGIVKEYVKQKTTRLSFADKEVAAAVLDRLAPTGGVKMSYPLDVLSGDINVPKEDIQRILDYWDQQRVVRPRQIGDVITYELYHDAFIKVLRPWIDEQLEEKRLREVEERRSRRRWWMILAVAGSLVLALVFFGFAAYAWIQRDFANRATAFASVNADAVSNPTTAAVALRDLMADERSSFVWVPTALRQLARKILRQEDSDQLARKSIARLDAGQMYFNKIVGRVLKVTKGATGPIYVTTSEDGSVNLWNAHGVSMAKLGANSDAIVDVAFSPDGQQLVAGSSTGKAQIWTIAADRAQRVKEIDLAGGPIAYSTFSKDGQTFVTITSGETDRVKLWTRDGTFVVELKGPLGHAIYATMSPNGRQVITLSTEPAPSIGPDNGPRGLRNVARLWNRNGDLVNELEDKDSVIYADFSPKGTYIVTASASKMAFLWNHAGRRIVGATPLGHSEPVVYASFSPDEQMIVTTSNDATARLWTIDGKLQREYRGHSGPVSRAAFSPDGNMIVTVSENIARLWDRTGTMVAELSGHLGPILYAEFSNDGTEVVTASNDSTRRWKTQGKPLIELKGHKLPVISAAFSKDGRAMVTTSADGTAWVWDRNGAGKQLSRGDVAISAMFAQDGKTIVTAATNYATPNSTATNNSAQLWNDDGTPKTQPIQLGGVLLASFSQPDGNMTFVTTGGDDPNTAKLLGSGGNEALLKGHEAQVIGAFFSPNGEVIATTSVDGTARLWGLDGKQIAKFTGHSNVVTYASFSGDGLTVLTSSNDSTARLWNREGKELAKFQHSGPVRRAAFSATGKFIVTASADGSAGLWNADGTPIKKLKHEGAVAYASFSPGPEDKYVVTASDDRTARLWDLRGEPLAELRGHRNSVTYAEFSPDGRMILTASADGTARLWPIDPLAFEERIRAIAVPCLSADERRTFYRTESLDEAQARADNCVKSATALQQQR